MSLSSLTSNSRFCLPLQRVLHSCVPMLQQRTESSAASLNNNSLKKYQDIPGPSSSFWGFIKFLPKMRKTFELFDIYHQTYGPIVRTKFYNFDGIFLTDSVAIENVLRKEGKYPQRTQIPVWIKIREENGLNLGLLLSEGETWSRMRRASDKVFMRPQNMSLVCPRVIEVNEDFIDRLREHRNKDGTIVINDEIPKWTLESTGNVLFERRFGTLENEQPPETKEFIDAVKDFFEYSNYLIIFPPETSKKLMPKKYQVVTDATNCLFKFSKESIDRKMEELKKEDLNDGQDRGILAGIAALGMSGRDQLAKDELYAILTELLGASIDTTSNAALFLLYEVSKNAELQNKLYQEILTVSPNGERPTYQSLQNVPLLRGCVKEILRLHPITNAIGRILQEDTDIMNYLVPAGTEVIMPLYSIGRDEKYYDDPLEFKPERWLRDVDGGRKKKIDPFTWLPFGFGSRSCIGRRFAEMEIHTLVFQLLQNFKIEDASVKPVGMKSRLMLVPDSDIKLKLTDRLSA